MKIYTKTGDKGNTSLYGGKIVRKDDVRIEAYGTVDELNSLMGMLLAKPWEVKIETLLRKVQNELFNIGSHLATESGDRIKLPAISKNLTGQLEKQMDRMDDKLEPLKTFILPGGSIVNAWAHLARTVCRRAERRVVSLSEHDEVAPEILIFLNRLSDYLFILARYASYRDGVPELKWNQEEEE